MGGLWIAGLPAGPEMEFSGCFKGGLENHPLLKPMRRILKQVVMKLNLVESNTNPHGPLAYIMEYDKVLCPDESTY